MNIVFAASEAVPYSKTGGLADVIGSLPRRLRTLGHSVTTVTPLYRCVRERGHQLEYLGSTLEVPVGPKTVSAALFRAYPSQPNETVLFLDQPHYFDRPALYGDERGDYPDNCERFAFFSRAVLETLRVLRLRADVLHLHDWQTALVPLMQKDLYAGEPHAGAPATLLTIHNMGYQGKFWHWDMPLLGLGWRRFSMEDLECCGDINFLKGGLVHADLLSTVSPTYAREICTPEHGSGLEGVLRQRRNDLHGIVNGLDEEEWDPARDERLKATYTADRLSGKAACKAVLMDELDLAPPCGPKGDAPLAAFVGRLDEQKAPDIIAKAAPGLLERGLLLAILGVGQAGYTKQFMELARAHPGRVAFINRFDGDLAHRFLAGADMVLMPSRYEACGLVQLAAMKYGAVPLAHRTGGLADTVVDATPKALFQGKATGFCFAPCIPQALLAAVDRALEAHRKPQVWRAIQRAGMKADWSWGPRAKQYADLYEKTVRTRRRRRP